MEDHKERNDTNEHNSRESLVAVVADGTGSNTGWKDGMLTHVERFIRAILLWLIFSYMKMI